MTSSFSQSALHYRFEQKNRPRSNSQNQNEEGMTRYACYIWSLMILPAKMLQHRFKVITFPLTFSTVLLYPHLALFQYRKRSSGRDPFQNSFSKFTGIFLTHSQLLLHLGDNKYFRFGRFNGGLLYEAGFLISCKHNERINSEKMSTRSCDR